MATNYEKIKTMISEKNHIGSNFDNFLKEENIEIKKEEIREQISNLFKDKCMEFLQKNLEPTSENYLKEQIEGVLKEAYDKRVIIPDYKIKRTKLPRKLKKKYKKERQICFDIEYRQPQRFEFTISIEESEEEVTTELEEQFFKVFGIEMQHLLDVNTNQFVDIYPEITDRKLLEMICVLSRWDADNYYQILANNMQDLKNEILNDCINFKQKLKNTYFNTEIQQLFKEEE